MSKAEMSAKDPVEIFFKDKTQERKSSWQSVFQSRDASSTGNYYKHSGDDALAKECSSDQRETGNGNSCSKTHGEPFPFLGAGAGSRGHHPVRRATRHPHHARSHHWPLCHAESIRQADTARIRHSTHETTG